MYDELVKRLREEAECPDNYPEDSNLMREAADAIEGLRAEVDLHKEVVEEYRMANMMLIDKFPKWIPVTERLPEVFKHVLVNIPGMSPHPTVQDAFREKNGMWYSNGFRYEADEVTHWMPLPEPPKEEDDG